jgi:F-type H+-transporting ATPase subunit epsilon
MALAADKMIHCRIHTPDGTVCDEQVAGVQLPASDGYMGILPNRAPVTAVVATGMITLTRTEGEPIELFVSRGFLQVNQNELTVMAEEFPLAQRGRKKQQLDEPDFQSLMR